jgi:hypothetical protein
MGTFRPRDQCGQWTLYLVRNQATWRGALVTGLHYTFWVLAIGERDYGNLIAPVVVSLPLSFLFPFSTIAWLRSLRVTRIPAAAP